MLGSISLVQKLLLRKWGYDMQKKKIATNNWMKLIPLKCRHFEFENRLSIWEQFI